MTEGADLFGEEHVRRYRETNGEVGHIWRRGAKTLLLTTKGRKTGEPRTTPPGLVSEPRQGAAGGAPGEGRCLFRPGAHRGRRRASAALEARCAAMAGLRRVPKADGSTDPGGRARAHLSEHSWGRGQGAEPTPGGGGRCELYHSNLAQGRSRLAGPDASKVVSDILRND